MEISGTKTRLLVDFFKRKVDDSQQIPSEFSPVESIFLIPSFWKYGGSLAHSIFSTNRGNWLHPNDFYQDLPFGYHATCEHLLMNIFHNKITVILNALHLPVESHFGGNVGYSPKK